MYNTVCYVKRENYNVIITFYLNWLKYYILILFSCHNENRIFLTGLHLFNAKNIFLYVIFNIVTTKPITACMLIYSKCVNFMKVL